MEPEPRFVPAAARFVLASALLAALAPVSGGASPGVAVHDALAAAALAAAGGAMRACARRGSLPGARFFSGFGILAGTWLVAAPFALGAPSSARAAILVVSGIVAVLNSGYCRYVACSGTRAL